jgi:quercetin dioxygenase-like cupin family protein
LVLIEKHLLKDLFMTRRDLNLLLPLLASAAAVAQDKKKLPSGTFKFEELPVKAGGENRTRAVLNGATHKGSAVEIHLTELGPGMAPHAPHKHPHEELVLVQYGELDVTIGGDTTRLTPGSVAFVASNEEHGWKNPTTARTQYFVIALGENQG